MKTCLCCGHLELSQILTCVLCGEASWKHLEPVAEPEAPILVPAVEPAIPEPVAEPAARKGRK